MRAGSDLLIVPERVIVGVLVFSQRQVAHRVSAWIDDGTHSKVHAKSQACRNREIRCASLDSYFREVENS